MDGLFLNPLKSKPFNEGPVHTLLLMSQRTVRTSFKDLLLLAYGMVHGHKSLHTVRVQIDFFSMQ